MRKLIGVILIAAILYGGYWFVGRSQIQTRLTDALTQLDAGETELRFDSLETKGFPSRFDTTITNLSFADPTDGVRWETPLLQLLALSYRPNNVRAYFPQEQVFIVNGERFTLITREMAARGQVGASGTLPFQQAELELLDPRLRTEAGAELALSRLFAATRLTPETFQTYDAFVEARDITLPDVLRRIIDPQNLQPPAITSLRIDSDVTLTAPIALNADTPIGDFETINIQELAFEWGEISLSAIGDVTPDADGVLSGSISISVRNWQQVFDLLIAAGVVRPDGQDTYLAMLGAMDETPQIPDTITATLTIRDGQMALGPLPLGAAPRLGYRQ